MFKNDIDSREFVREPVDEVVNDILESDKNRIIITGRKGSGKSTVLYSLQKRGLGSRVKTIYNSLDSRVALSKEPNEEFTNQILNCYYESQFISNLLKFIELNYPLMYQEYFENDKYISSITSDFNKMIKNIKNEPDYLLKIRDVATSVINKFRECSKLAKLNLALDGFDRVNGSSEYVQKLYEEYFNMFDKVILSSEDPLIDSERLINSGYDIKNINYGTDKRVLREIIKRRLEKKINNLQGEQDYTPDYFLKKLSVFNGNIDAVLSVLDYFSDMYLDREYNPYYYDIRLRNKIEFLLGYEELYNHKFDRMNGKPTLHL